MEESSPYVKKIVTPVYIFRKILDISLNFTEKSQFLMKVYYRWSSVLLLDYFLVEEHWLFLLVYKGNDG